MSCVSFAPNTSESLRISQNRSLTELVFTSPEIATSKLFAQGVLRNSEFYNRFCLLAVDEVHTVDEWAGFRPDYMNIFVLRARLPEKVPLFATSATIPDDLLVELKQSCGFRQNPSIMRTSLDHPEIYLQLSAAKHPMKGMLDLQHLLPETATIATDIPKTIIFMDSCAMILEAERLFRNWMADLDYPTESNTWVKPYFSSMAKVDKIATSETFGQISSECLATRILIATDAYGLGIDNPDVARVVQWQAPPSMSKLYQRLGRAMRNGSGLTSFLRIYQPSLVGPRSNKVLKRNQHDSGASGKILEDSEGKTKNNDKGATRRANLSLGLWEMINAPGQVCVRNVGLQHFSARDASASSRPPSDRCCSSCHPELAVELKTPPKLETKDWEDARRAPWIQHHLIVWREQKMLAVLSVRWHDKPSYNMPESVLQLLAQRASKAKSIESLRRVIGNGWPQLRQYWQEILAIT